MKKIIYVLVLTSLVFAGGCTQVQELDGDSETGGRLSQQAPSVNDGAIVSAVKTALNQDEMLVSSNISVTANQGVVTLSGSVPNALAYNRAISVASRVQGVKRPVKAIDLVYPE